MHYFNLHTHIDPQNPDITALVNQYPWEPQGDFTSYSIGIHPWYIDLNRFETDFAVMRKAVSDPRCWAIGECGLDKRITIPLDVQQTVFKAQAALAQEVQKPLVLHVVAAYQEMIALKNELRIQVPMIVHGFSKNAQTARQLLENGFYLSFGKYLLRNPELGLVFAEIPNDRFFLETDTIEEGIEAVYQKAAESKGLTVAEIQAQVAQNLQTVFKVGL